MKPDTNPRTASAPPKPSRHTEGPWQSVSADHDPFTIIGAIDGPDEGRYHYTEVCTVNEGAPDAVANARLIIAAPELLRAAWAFLAEFDRYFGNGAPGRASPKFFDPSRGALRRALFKAEPRFTPQDCPHCAYDRKFYGGGWVYGGNNGPIKPCPVCNDDGLHPRRDPDDGTSTLCDRADSGPERGANVNQTPDPNPSPS